MVVAVIAAAAYLPCVSITRSVVSVLARSARVWQCCMPCLACDIWWQVACASLGCEQQRDCFIDSGMAPRISGTNQQFVFKQGEIVLVRSCGPIAQ